MAHVDARLASSQPPDCALDNGGRGWAQHDPGGIDTQPYKSLLRPLDGVKTIGMPDDDNHVRVNDRLTGWPDRTRGVNHNQGDLTHRLPRQLS